MIKLSSKIRVMFNPDYPVGVDAEVQDYDLVRLEGFEGHIYKVIWPKSLKALMGTGLRATSQVYIRSKSWCASVLLPIA